ncbi:LOG family protein [Candidatus Peribacteria bacterium]|nr:LOG family protein [Candidatus Peribacteria bacterium]
MQIHRNIFDLKPEYTMRVGVFGSASGYLMRSEAAVNAAYEVGRQIALRGGMLINGACPGLPDEAARGCKEAGGATFGVSPAASICSHLQKYKSPVEHYDGFLFTGLGLMVRDIINVRSSNCCIILPGGTGTLNEFTVAYDEGKPIGVLDGYDGVADHIPQILEYCHREVTDRMVISSDPAELVEKLMHLTRRVDEGCMLDDYLVGDDGEVTKIEAQARTTKY